jgi:hypothetical protein
MYLWVLYRLGYYQKRYAGLDHRTFKFCTDLKPQLPSLPFLYQPTSDAVREQLEGRISALGFTWGWTGDDNDWHLAPDTGRSWPRLFFDRIGYRQGNPTGDVRVAWEPSRLQHLVELALITIRSSSDREQGVALLERQLASWMHANPPGCGIHYISAMECGLRLIAVCHALDLVRTHLMDRDAVWNNAASLVASHADLITQRLSLHSSSGNHTIAECAALVYAGVLFPEIARAEKWTATGLSLLSREADRQILGDGGGIERSPWYHLFVVDLLGLVAQLLAFKDQVVPREIGTAVERGRRFITALAQFISDLPRQGDADDGYALSPYLRLSWDRPVERKTVATFPEYGLTRVETGRDRPIQLLLDHGPLGMAPSYGHGHADALSLTLRLDERELLVDTGTYTYTGASEWRSYFRSTRAHNTVCIDGLDQAQQETPFQWSKPYTAELVGNDTAEDGVIYLQARHDGYSDLGIEHFRSLIIVPDRLLIVQDRILGEGHHTLDLYWHLATEPLVENRTLRFEGYGHPLRMRLQDADFSLHRGETHPIRGWRSLRYGVREPITTVSKSYSGKLPYEFVTTIELDDNGSTPESITGYLDRAQALFPYSTPT